MDSFYKKNTKQRQYWNFTLSHGFPHRAPSVAIDGAYSAAVLGFTACGYRQRALPLLSSPSCLACFRPHAWQFFPSLFNIPALGLGLQLMEPIAQYTTPMNKAEGTTEPPAAPHLRASKNSIIVLSLRMCLVS
jgi:hypothetical protein